MCHVLPYLLLSRVDDDDVRDIGKPDFCSVLLMLSNANLTPNRQVTEGTIAKVHEPHKVTKVPRIITKVPYQCFKTANKWRSLS